MSDDLTRAIAEALHHDDIPMMPTADLAERIAAALAPLLEARVREARAWGAAGALTALAHEVEDLDAADLATYRARQWESEAEEVRRG